jgi:hypothetical protein
MQMEETHILKEKLFKLNQEFDECSQYLKTRKIIFEELKVIILTLFIDI